MERNVAILPIYGTTSMIKNIPSVIGFLARQHVAAKICKSHAHSDEERFNATVHKLSEINCQFVLLNNTTNNTVTVTTSITTSVK